MRKATYLDFPLGDYKDRYERVRKLMEEADIDALFLTNRTNVEYVTGFSTISWRQHDKQFYVVITRNDIDEVVLIVDYVHEGNAENTSWVEDVRLWGKKVQYVDLAIDTIGSLGLEKATIGMELGSNQRIWATPIEFDAIKNGLSEAKIVDASHILNNMQTIKSKLEIERLRKACQITGKSLRDSFECFKEGMSERDFSNIIVQNMLEQGADSPSYGNTDGYLSFKAGRFDQMTPTPVDRKIEKGDFIRFDGGAVYKNYQSDIMRMGLVGQKPNKDHEKIYAAVTKGMERVDETIKPGASASQIYSSFLDTIKEEGYGNLLPDNMISAMDYWASEKGTFFGHGIGFNIHQEPFLISDSNKTLEENMVIAFEVGLSVSPGSNCVLEIEDNFLVTKNGCERLSTLDRKIWELTY